MSANLLLKNWAAVQILTTAACIYLTSFFLTSDLAAQYDQEPADMSPPEIPEPNDEGSFGHLNIDWKTMGGTQFWTDQLIFRGWRIQENILTKHCRLLDENNVRRAWGTFVDCKNQLEQSKRELNLMPLQGKVVFALHGLTRTRNSMDGLCSYLEEQNYTAINMSYASTRTHVADHAVALANVLANLEGDVEIYMVAHSLGNLVIRHYFGDCQKRGVLPDPRIRRVVMLAPPNHGSATAETFKNRAIFKLFWGESGRQIADWEELKSNLGTPNCEFGIIAGDAGGNPLLEGEQDFVVTVEETKLSGACDFIVLPVMHSTIMDNEAVRDATLRFFETGCFQSQESKTPIK